MGLYIHIHSINGVSSVLITGITRAFTWEVVELIGDDSHATEETRVCHGERSPCHWMISMLKPGYDLLSWYVTWIFWGCWIYFVIPMLVAFRLYSNPPEKMQTRVQWPLFLVGFYLSIFFGGNYILCWDLPKMVHPKLVIDVFLTDICIFRGNRNGLGHHNSRKQPWGTIPKISPVWDPEMYTSFATPRFSRGGLIISRWIL